MKDNIIIDSSYNRLDNFIEKQTQDSSITGEIYLTAGGYYQDSYIAIFEELTSNDNSSKTDSDIVEANVEFIAELFIKKLIRKFPNKLFPFNKILSVTLPSQIIAKAIHRSLKKYSDIKYYSNKNGNSYLSDLPKLIRLASYYSFSEEVQFKNILPGDKVVVVNDVISTGNLIKDIQENISSIGAEDEDKRAASVSCVLSVVDSRVPLSNIDIKKHKKSIYFNFTNEFSENSFISLRKKEIYKFNENPDTTKKLVRINPILNARVTIESRHSEEEKIAFKNVEDFLEYIPTEAMAIGHFTENSLHHQYFFKPEILFKNNFTNKENTGIKLVRDIYRKVISKEQKYDLDYNIKTISSHINSLEEILKEYSNNTDYNITKIKNQLLAFTKKTKKITKYKSAHDSQKMQLLKKTDFLFYPVFSGIESDDLVDELYNIFRINYDNVIPLQRFDTNKGWRFIVPQKSYNDRLQGRKAIILDMGSFTGDSIIQMIDALCVFELKKIVVISLIGRLEDFNREFFSRIRELKVKVLNSNKTVKSTNNSFIESALAPINIYFGTNLHFPASRSTKICEHCKEISNLKALIEIKEFKTTSAIKYIEKRLQILNVIHVDDIENRCPLYFPKNKKTNSYDIINFFTVRDHLGKIDGYRFYTDYYEYFDKLTEDSNNFKLKIEAIIAITLHEKHLVKTIENQLPDVKKKITNYIYEIIHCKDSLQTMHYKWSILSILESYFLYNNPAEIFDKDNFISILNFIENNSSEDAIEFSFIAFKMAESYYFNKNNNHYYQDQFIKSVKEIWLEIEDKNTLKYFSVIAKFNRMIVNDNLATGSDEVKPFFNLFNMYNSASGYKPSHSDLGVPVDNLNTSIVAHNIHQNISDNEFELNFTQEFYKAKTLFGDLLHNMTGVSNYLNSLNKLFEKNKFHPEYFGGEKYLSKYFEKIEKIISAKPFKNHLVEIQVILKDMQNEYFNPSIKNSFYSLWKTSFYVSVATILKNFKEKNYKNGINNDLFKVYVDNKNYYNLIKTNLKCFDIIEKENYSDVGVNIPPFLLVKIIKELLDNSFNYAKDSCVEVSLKDIICEDLGLKYSVLSYYQDNGAKGKPKKGLEAVEKILKDFKGSFNYDDSKKDELTIEIKIQVTKYNIL